MASFDLSLSLLTDSVELRTDSANHSHSVQTEPRFLVASGEVFRPTCSLRKTCDNLGHSTLLFPCLSDILALLYSLSFPVSTNSFVSIVFPVIFVLFAVTCIVLLSIQSLGPPLDLLTPTSFHELVLRCLGLLDHHDQAHGTQRVTGKFDEVSINARTTFFWNETFTKRRKVMHVSWS